MFLRTITAVVMITLTIFIAGCSEKVPKSAQDTPEDDGCVEIRMACTHTSSQLNYLISRFNEQNSNYKIILVQYRPPDSSKELLLTEIISGNAPDIFASFGSELSEITDSGAYEDLLPYLEKEQSCNADIFIPSIFNAITKGGKLYRMPYDFTISTYYARESVVGTAEDLTMEKAEKLAKSLGNIGVFPHWQTKEVFLNAIYSFSLSHFIDESSDTCSFDSPDFVALLKKCNEQSEEIPESDNIMQEKSLLYAYPLQSLSMTRGLKMQYGNDYCFVGFPTENGGASCFDLNLNFGIYALSKNKEAAWSFIRFTLSEESQNNTEFFPVNQRAFDADIAQDLANGQIALQSGEVGLEKLNADKLLRVIEETTDIGSSKEEIYNIMLEESGSYFGGDKTAEEAAKLIQSRVSIYLAEQA